MNSENSNNSVIELKKKLREIKSELANKEDEINQLKSNFLSNVSHEIRTPMNVIVGFTNLLADPSYGEEQKKYFISEINHNSKELLRIIDHLIFSAKIDSEEFVPKMDFIHVSKIRSALQNHVDYLLKHPRYGKITVRQKNFGTYKKCSVFTDELQVIKALTLIIENAMKFTVFGIIEYGIEVAEKTITFYVRDSGTEMELRNLKNLLENINMEGQTQYSAESELGIGLAVASRIISVLGGKLRVKSVLGKGSSFYFTIPLLVEKPV